MTAMLLFLGGCQREEMLSEQYDKDNKLSVQKYLKLHEIPELNEFIIKKMRMKGSRNEIKISDIDTSRVLEVYYSEQYKTYSFNINHNEPNKLFNLVFKRINGIFYKPVVVGYHLREDFVVGYNKGEMNFDDFVGTISLFKFDNFFNTSRSIPCPCWEKYREKVVVVSVVPNSEEGSGGGGSGGSGGSGNTGTFGNNSNGGGIIITTSGNTGTGTSTSGNTGSGSSGGQGNTGSSGCPPGYIPIYVPFFGFICVPLGPGGGGKEEEMLTFTSGNGAGRNEDCPNFPDGAGIIMNEDNKVNAPEGEVHDQFKEQINSCLSDPEIKSKIEELQNKQLINTCTNEMIEIDVEMLALDKCFGCGQESSGLTPQTLQDAYDMMTREQNGVDLTKIHNFLKDKPINPCSGKEYSQEDITNELCDSPDKSAIGVQKVLDDLDYIIVNIDPAVCPQVSCILSKLFNYNFGTNDSPGFSYLDCDANGYTFNTGLTSGDGLANWTTKTITINQNLCNNNADPINIAETILHESMHLALWAVQVELNNGNANINPDLLNAVNDLNNNFSGNHHEYLAAYLEGIANTLWNLNGQVGTKEDYYGLIWNGLSEGAGLDPNTNQAYSLYITQVMNTPGYNPNSLNYKDWIESQLNRYRNLIKPFNNLKFDCP